MIKLCLIGLGNMGSLHLKNILSLEEYNICRLCAVCDIDGDLLNKICSKYHLNGYKSVEDLISNEQFDAAIIATTSSSHFEIAGRLVKRRIPVLIEKPVVLNTDDANELMKLSSVNNVLITAGFTEVYNSVTTGAQSILKDKADFSYFDFFRIGQKNPRNDKKDIDVVHDLMVHDIAVLAQMTDLRKIKDVSGYFSSYNEISKKYDMACVSLIMDSDRIVRFFCDRNATTKIRRFTFSKDDMYGEFDFMDQTAQVFKRGKLEAFGDNIWYSQNYDGAKIRYSNNPLLDEIKDFVLAVKNASETKVSSYWFDVTISVEKIRSALYDKINLIK